MSGYLIASYRVFLINKIVVSFDNEFIKKSLIQIENRLLELIGSFLLM